MGETTTNQEEPKDLEEAVLQTMGFVSACWTDLEKAGVFQSEQARAHCHQLIDWVNDNYILRGGEGTPDGE